MTSQLIMPFNKFFFWFYFTFTSFLNVLLWTGSLVTGLPVIDCLFFYLFIIDKLFTEWLFLFSRRSVKL